MTAQWKIKMEEGTLSKRTAVVCVMLETSSSNQASTTTALFSSHKIYSLVQFHRSVKCNTESLFTFIYFSKS